MQLNDITVSRLAQNDVCAIATDRFHRIALWRQLFTALIFTVAAAIVVFAVLAVVFATNKEWAATIATALGALAGGAPLKWVLARHREAVQEEQKAFNEYREACGSDDRASSIAAAVKFP